MSSIPRKISENPYFSVPIENMSKSGKEIGGLSASKLKAFDARVNRMNSDLYQIRHDAKQNGTSVPKIYHDKAKQLVDAWFNDAQYNHIDKKNTMVTIAEENFVLDREKARTYYDHNVAAQIFAPVTRALSAFKWDVKHYLIEKVANVVKLSREFNNPRMINLKTTGQLDRGMGWYAGYNISRWKLLENQGELFDLQYETMLECSAQMGRAAHEHILTGGTVEHGGTDDSGEAGSGLSLLGFCNHGSLQSFSISTLTTYNNIYLGLKAGLSTLKKVFASNNTILITSGGIADQVERNEKSYTDLTEKMKIQRDLVGAANPIKQWWITDQITGAAISNSTQKAVLIKMDPRLLSRLIVLPLQTLDSLDGKQWKDDVNEVMLAADILRYNNYDSTENAFPGAEDNTLTTTSVGYRSNERFL